MTDLYADLGVAKEADAAEIKAAYRSKSKSAHPDAGGSTARWQRLQLAYTVLSDPERRRRYDESGSVSEPMRVEQKALGILAQLVSSFVEMVTDVEDLDLVDSLTKALTRSLAEMDAEVDKLRHKIAGLHTVGTRIFPKGVDRKLSGVVAGVAAQLEEMLEKLDQARRPFELALKIVESNHFVVPDTGFADFVGDDGVRVMTISGNYGSSTTA